MITLVAALAKNNVIGNAGSIPWYLPEDFKHFKKVTTGKTIVMGSATWESLPKALPNRRNVVVSRKMKVSGQPDDLMDDLGEALALDEDIMVIGGGKVYEQTIDIADRMILSHIDQEPDGDAFFPKIDMQEWKIVSREPHEGFEVITYERA